MNITMEGAYAYDCDPYTQVRILCVDRPGSYPIISMSMMGDVRPHTFDGLSGFGGAQYNLIPLQKTRKPVEAWAVEVRGGTTHTGLTWARSIAEEAARRTPGSRIIRLIEAPEDAQ